MLPIDRQSRLSALNAPMLDTGAKGRALLELVKAGHGRHGLDAIAHLPAQAHSAIVAHAVQAANARRDTDAALNLLDLLEV